MKFYKDLEGKIPCKDGDRVALAIDELTGVTLQQPDPRFRPTLQQEINTAAAKTMKGKTDE